MRRVAAVDLGATSARVAVVDVDEPRDRWSPDIVHRYAHTPVRAEDGTLRWDWERLVAEVEVGLERALEGGPLASIGVDAWGVDYGLVDADGALVAPPFSYRDDRVESWEGVADRIGRDRLYRTTGIQLMPINTVFQLALHDPRELDRAAAVLMLPELLVHHLTGVISGEATSAATTGLIDVKTGDWSDELLGAIGLDRARFPAISAPGTWAGNWRDVPVHLVAGHDTASAVAARPADPPERSAFVSAGTWLLVGAERAAPDTSDAARAANFSNERGATGNIRFLKNVQGLWLLERCRAAWGDPPMDRLVAAAAALAPGGPTVDPNDGRFASGDDMEAALRGAAGLSASAGRGAVVRCILDSLAAATAVVVDELAPFLGGPVERIDVVGGGAGNPLFVRLLREATGVDVMRGPVEATALGNARVQLSALDNVES